MACSTCDGRKPMQLHPDGTALRTYIREERESLAKLGFKIVTFARRCAGCGTRNVIFSMADGKTCMNCEVRARKKAKQSA